MKTLVYLSRAFVEFGPFTTKEMMDFHRRGLLRDIDHLRWHGEEEWLSVDAWLASSTVPAKTAPKPKTKAAAPKVAEKAKVVAEKIKPKAAKKPKKAE